MKARAIQEMKQRTVNVVVVCIVAGEVLQRIPREGESAVIIDRLHGRDDEEEEGLTRREADDLVREDTAARVERKAFERVVVERAEGVRHVEAVVPGVDGAVQEGDLMCRPVHHVLPAVEDKAAARGWRSGTYSGELKRRLGLTPR